MGKPIKHLVLDTNAFIRPVEQLHNIAENFYAPPGVLAEARCSRSKIKLDTFPFEIRWVEPSLEAFQKVVEEAKRVGNYPELSAVDLKVIALTYDLTQRHPTKSSNKALDGLTVEQVEASIAKIALEEAEAGKPEETPAGADAAKEVTTSSLPPGFAKDDDSEEEGWLTAESLDAALNKLGAIELCDGAEVGCLTTDYAVQNVLLHMHLELISFAGYRIQRLQTYVLRCRACYGTTSNMTKEFCQKCGNKSLHKCAVTRDKDGKEQLHINWNRLTNLRGLKYSMPAPRGGKHAIVEKIVEDQRMPDQRKPRHYGRVGIRNGAIDVDNPFDFENKQPTTRKHPVK
ncbi:unnamed protein product, partial [Mesorhabditis spiculigera]